MKKKLIFKISSLLFLIATIFSYITVFFAGYGYGDMVCGIQYAAYSAPAWVGILSAVPYLIVTIAFGVLAFVLKRIACPKIKKQDAE